MSFFRMAWVCFRALSASLQLKTVFCVVGPIRPVHFTVELESWSGGGGRRRRCQNFGLMFPRGFRFGGFFSLGFALARFTRC